MGNKLHENTAHTTSIGQNLEAGANRMTEGYHKVEREF